MAIGILGVAAKKMLRENGYQFNETAVVFVNVHNGSAKIDLDGVKKPMNEGSMDAIMKLSEKAKTISGFTEIHACEINVWTSRTSCEFTFYGISHEGKKAKRTLTL